MAGEGNLRLDADDDPYSELNVLRREVRQLQSAVRDSGLQIAAHQDEIIELRSLLSAAETEIDDGLARETAMRAKLAVERQRVASTMAAAESLVSLLRATEDELGSEGPEHGTTHATRADSERVAVPDVDNGVVAHSDVAAEDVEPRGDSDSQQLGDSEYDESIESGEYVASDGTGGEEQDVGGTDEGASIPPTDASDEVPSSVGPADVARAKAFLSDMTLCSGVPAVVEETKREIEQSDAKKTAVRIPQQQRAFVSRTITALGAADAAPTPASPPVVHTVPTRPPAVAVKARASSNLLKSAFRQGAPAVTPKAPAIHTSGGDETLPSAVVKIMNAGGPPPQSALPSRVSYAASDAHSGEVFALAASVDGVWLASGGDDRHIRVFDMRGGPDTMAVTIGENNRAITALDFHPDIAMGGLSGALLICSGSSDGLLRSFRRNPRRRGRWSLTSVLPAHGQAVRRLLFRSMSGSSSAQEASCVLSASTSREILLTDLEHGKRPFVVSATSAVLDVSFFTENGNGLIASGHRDGAVRLWDVRDASQGNVGEMAKVHSKGVISVSCLDDGHGICTLGRDNMIRLCDTRMGVQVVREMDDGVETVSDWHRLTTDGRHIACGIGPSGALGIWNVDTGKTVRKLTSQLPDPDANVLGMVRAKLRNPGAVVLPLWTTSGTFVSAHRTRQISFWYS